MNFIPHQQHFIQPPAIQQPVAQPPVAHPIIPLPAAPGGSITSLCIPFLGPNLGNMNDTIANKIKLLDLTELGAYQKKKELELELYKKQLDIDYAHQQRLRSLEISHLESIREKEINYLHQLHSISEGHSRAYAEKLGHIV